MNSKPRLTGKFYRIVGGKLDGNDYVGGVVVEAFEIREPKPPAKAKPSAE